MKLNGIKGLVMGLLVAVVFFISAGSTTANAQGRRYCGHRRVVFYRHFDPFWDFRTYRVVDPIATLQEQGYSDGRNRGKDDARDGRGNNPYDQKQYYKSNSLAYREAFLKGYAEGYRKQSDRAD